MSGDFISLRQKIRIRIVWDITAIEVIQPIEFKKHKGFA